LFIAIVFLHMVFFLQNYLLFFLILSRLKITVTICEESTLTFLENYCWLLHCFFPRVFFPVFVMFFPKIICQFYFLNTKLVKNYNYNIFFLFFNIEPVKNYSYNMWGKHFNFPRKLLLVATLFFPTCFFFCFRYVFS
jgi:hypothetical protein